jgi:ribosomal protein S18 acetylase RimI-like enzyme
VTAGGHPVIVVDEKPDPGLRDEILRPLRAFNESQVGPLSTELLAICLRHPDTDSVIGGLWGRSVADWLYVDLLVVPEDRRGRGLGTSLIRKAEQIARKRGCTGIWLYTATFQAPGFYEKMGFRIFGKLADYPKGHDNIYYMKRLDA